MTDIQHKQNPQKKEYTYVNNLADFKSRIDRFRVGKQLQNKNPNNAKLPFRPPDDNTNLFTQT